MRYDVENASDKHLALVLSQYQKSNDVNYTLSCYCTEDFALGSPSSTLAHCKELSGSWSTHSAGGPVGSRNFFRNPQYAVNVPVATQIYATLSTSKTIPCNLILVPVSSKGKLAETATLEPIIDTGAYRHAFVASKETKVQPGSYALIVSTYREEENGLFDLKLFSSSPQVTMERIQNS